MRYRQTKRSCNSYWTQIIYKGEIEGNDPTIIAGATAATTYIDYFPAFAFDGDPSTFYWSDGGPPQWLQIGLSTPAILTSMDLTYNDTVNLSFYVMGSNGESWDTLADVSLTNAPKEKHTVPIDNTNDYRYYRLSFYATDHSNRYWIKIFDWTLYSGDDEINLGL